MNEHPLDEVVAFLKAQLVNMKKTNFISGAGDVFGVVMAREAAKARNIKIKKLIRTVEASKGKQE